MAFYEITLIIRQDVSSTDVDRLTDQFTEILASHGSKVHNTEYWGLRSLAYPINNNKKGHYVMIVAESSFEATSKLESKAKLTEDIIRCLTVKVKTLNKKPSPILDSKLETYDDIVDVTASI
ncbi:MAG: 30S ribosomal protein S6 [Rickettsiaceae bacterium]|nr:30S ribosomal protein S6 [Rickettsiaceae bacterium]